MGDVRGGTQQQSWLFGVLLVKFVQARADQEQEQSNEFFFGPRHAETAVIILLQFEMK